MDQAAQEKELHEKLKGWKMLLEMTFPRGRPNRDEFWGEFKEVEALLKAQSSQLEAAWQLPDILARVREREKDLCSSDAALLYHDSQWHSAWTNYSPLREALHALETYADSLQLPLKALEVPVRAEVGAELNAIKPPHPISFELFVELYSIDMSFLKPAKTILRATKDSHISKVKGIHDQLWAKYRGQRFTFHALARTPVEALGAVTPRAARRYQI